jgi:hypothetical protein
MLPKISRQPIQDFLKTERAILLLCMSIALIFWLFVQLSQTQQTVLEIPVQFDVPKGKILVEKPPTYLLITLESDGWGLFYRSFRGKLKILNWKVKENKILIYENLKDKIADKIPKNVEIKNISPRQISLKLDAFVQKEVEVRLNATVETVSQFQLSNDIQLLPNKIKITGPKIILEEINFIETEKIDIENLRQNQFGEIKLSETRNKQVKYSPANVNYMMTIEQFSEKTLLVPISIQTDSTINIHVMPSMAKVTCTVGLSKYEILNGSFFEVEVQMDSTALANGKPLNLQLKKAPDWVKNIKIMPKKVDFVIIE